MARKLLLYSGVAAALIYIGSDIIAALRWDTYSIAAQSVSELRAVDAPTSSFLLPILLVYSFLEVLFGFGIWFSANQRTSLRVVGALLITLGALELASSQFFNIQLHLSEEVTSFANLLHIIATSMTVFFIFLIIGFGAFARGTWFRVYSFATLLTVMVFGVLAFLELPKVAANLPHPYLGIIERINIYGYMIWLAVLAVILLRPDKSSPAEN